MRLSQVVAQVGGELAGDAGFVGVSTDSRTLQAGEWFVALRGERYDGHDHVAVALEKGASALIVERLFPGVPVAQWVVADSLQALQALAVYWRQQCSGVRRFALTGSSGKTTTKEMLASMLATQGATHATRGNLNNQIGVPLTVLQMRPEHRFGVFELGASHAGEITEIARLIAPECVAITNVGSAHLEGFGSREGIARAKAEIYAAVQPGGRAVLNRDDEFYPWCRQQAAHLHTVSVSLQDPAAEVSVRGMQADASGCYRFEPLIEGKIFPWVQLPIMGKHNVLNACMALAMAWYEPGLDPLGLLQGLALMPGIPGRMHRETFGKMTLIDDTYNANPASVRSAIDVLAAQQGKKILVLGDMAELGEGVREEHRGVGEWAAMKKIDALYVVGDYAQWVAEGFANGAASGAKVLPDKQQLLAELHTELQGVVSILVKGSRSSQMEDIVQGLSVQGLRQTTGQPVRAPEDGSAC